MRACVWGTRERSCGSGGLTRSTMFFLLVSARGPDTKASHCSCCSAGISARREGQGQDVRQPSASPPRAPSTGEPPHPSAAAPAARHWVPSPCSAPGRWPFSSGGPCSLSAGRLRTWVGVEAEAGHWPPATPATPHPKGRREGHSLHALVLLPGCQDAFHQAALLQQLWGDQPGSLRRPQTSQGLRPPSLCSL